MTILSNWFADYESFLWVYYSLHVPIPYLVESFYKLNDSPNHSNSNLLHTYLSTNQNTALKFQLVSWLVDKLVEQNIFCTINPIRCGEGGTVLWMGFYTDISWESRCCSEIKIWGHLCQIFVVFEVWKLPKFDNCYPNLASFLSLHVNRIVCMGKISLGSARVLKNY